MIITEVRWKNELLIKSDECTYLKNSNAELLDALKTLLAFVNSFGMEFGGVPKEKYLEVDNV